MIRSFKLILRWLNKSSKGMLRPNKELKQRNEPTSWSIVLGFFLILLFAQEGKAQEAIDHYLSADCYGLTFIDSTDPVLAGLVTFDIEASDPVGEAYVNQVIDLVSDNLKGWAKVTPDFYGLDVFGNLRSQGKPASEVQIAELNLSDEAVLLDIPSEPAFRWIISGVIEQDQQELTQLTLSIIPPGFSESESQSLTIRAGITDWDRVAHYLSDLIFESFDIQHGLFQSQVLFIAEKETKNGTERRLAIMDQSGDGLNWIADAGTSVGFATFLETRFDVAYLDQGQNRNHLVYLNLLTDRTTPLVQLPDLQGHPDLGASGRFIAFASSESDDPTSKATDMIVVDVEAALVQTISRPGTSERDPSFSSDLSSLVMVSEDEEGSEILIVQFQEPLGQQDRTKGESSLEVWDPIIIDIYKSQGQLHHPSWSPDQKSLTFIEESSGVDHLMILEIETKEVSRILSGNNLAHPVWSPHPDFIALISEAGDQDQLLRLDLGRSQIRHLQTPFTPDAPAWSPPQP